MRTARASVAGLLVVALMASGCYGPFNLTRRLYRWNGQISQDKWAVEAVFIVCAWAPVYLLAGLGDSLVFNSIEFWGGKNPVEPPSAQGVQTRRIAKADAAVVLSRNDAGTQFALEQFRGDQSAGSLRIEPRDGMLVGTDAQGQVLFTAQTLDDGSVRVTDAKGRQVAAYSVEQITRLQASRL